MQPKYRAWYQGKMWKVETMYVADIDNGFTRIRISRINYIGEYEWDFPFGKDLELMLFVGLDKNGQEIYESDIVAYRHMGTLIKDVVLYDHERAGFTPFMGVVRGPDWIHVKMNCVERVGNIFQAVYQSA